MPTIPGESDPDLIISFFDQPCVQLADVEANLRFDLEDIPKTDIPRLTITVQDESYLVKKAGV